MIHTRSGLRRNIRTVQEVVCSRVALPDGSHDERRGTMRFRRAPFGLFTQRYPEFFICITQRAVYSVRRNKQSVSVFRPPTRKVMRVLAGEVTEPLNVDFHLNPTDDDSAARELVDCVSWTWPSSVPEVPGHQTEAWIEENDEYRKLCQVRYDPQTRRVYQYESRAWDNEMTQPPDRILGWLDIQYDLPLPDDCFELPEETRAYTFVQEEA